MNASVLWKVTVLVAGPALSVLAVPAATKGFALPGEGPLITLVVLALWSPLFFSIPALILADARDRALPHLRGVVGSFVRGFALVPALLRSGSPVRAEMTASIVGFAAGLILAAPVLTQLPAII